MEGTGDIKVITGVRRSGKSELMKAFSAELKKRDPLSNSLYIDLLDLDNEELLEYHALHDRIAKSHKDGVRNRLFIDEVQRCEGFERAINSIHARGGWDIYLTGSNAFLLSSDLDSLDDDLDRYIECGGLAGSYGYRDMAESYGYIRDVYRTILTRDSSRSSGCPTRWCSSGSPST